MRHLPVTKNGNGMLPKVLMLATMLGMLLTGAGVPAADAHTTLLNQRVAGSHSASGWTDPTDDTGAWLWFRYETHAPPVLCTATPIPCDTYKTYVVNGQSNIWYADYDSSLRANNIGTICSDAQITAEGFNWAISIGVTPSIGLNPEVQTRIFGGCHTNSDEPYFYKIFPSDTLIAEAHLMWNIDGVLDGTVNVDGVGFPHVVHATQSCTFSPCSV